jgi:hypothetical protein
LSCHDTISFQEYNVLVNCKERGNAD